jgi:L-iditol 2-dehydrogenase
LPGGQRYIRSSCFEDYLWDKTIRFSWLASFTWVEAIQAVDSGLVEVNKLITHHFPLES